MLESYTKGIKRLSMQLQLISQEHHVTMGYLWLSALMAHIRYGVTPNQYIGYRFFEKNHIGRKEFYTLRHAKKYEKLLNDPTYYESFWDKAKFNAIFKNFVHRDWLLCGSSEGQVITDFLAQHDHVLVKPTGLSSGHGIHTYSRETPEELIAGKFLLEEFVVQDEHLSVLNPTSVNTIRVYTMIDSEGAPHVLTCSLRVGGKGSEVDNYHSGGVGYPIDPETGVVMGAGADIMGIRHYYHPGTGIKVIGFEIPKWAELLNFVTSACLVIPSARLIAWDVAVTPDGFEMIEGNYDGDPGFMQTPSGIGQLRKIKEWM